MVKNGQRFTIHGRLPSLNEYTRINRANARAANRMKQDLQTQIGWEIKAAKVEPVNGPVRIVYRWIEPNMNRDKDNISFGQKFVQDALVRMGILPDDGWKWVAEFEHQFSVDKRNPRVEIEIVEVSE